MKLCQDCYYRESTCLSTKLKCEAMGCKRKIIEKSDYRVVYVYDDVVPFEERRFRDMILCSMHSGFSWMNKSGAVLLASAILRGLSEKWGTRNGPKGKYIDAPQFDKVTIF